jgi:hypothetical protein
MAYMVNEYGVSGTGVQTIMVAKGARLLEAIVRSGQTKVRAIIDPAVIETEQINLIIVEQGLSFTTFVSTWLGVVTLGAKTYDVFRTS